MLLPRFDKIAQGPIPYRTKEFHQPTTWYNKVLKTPLEKISRILKTITKNT